MAIDPDLVECLRTRIRDDDEANRLVQDRLDARGWGDDFGLLLNATCFFAVRLRFGDQPDPVAIVRFVAALRSWSPDIAAAVDPAIAEAAILDPLHPDLPAGTDPETVAMVQTLTIYKILTEAVLDDTGLDELLAKAAQLAGSGVSPETWKEDAPLQVAGGDCRHGDAGQ